LAPGATRSGEGNPGFVEIASADPMVQAAFSTSGLSIHFRDGIRIEVFPDTDRDFLAWVLQELRKPA
jgi:hypothetical protein